MNPSNQTDKKTKLWLGLPPSEPDNYQGPWEKQEHWVIWLALFWALVLLVTYVISITTDDQQLATILSPPDSETWKRIGFQGPLMLLVIFLLGLAVEKLGINVAYTRKFGHIIGNLAFPLFVIPPTMIAIDLYRDWYLSFTWRVSILYVFPYLLFLRPIRSRIRFFYYCLRSIDRPEDRPYTLIWFLMQMIAMGMILIPMTQYFVHQGMWSLYLIPAIANGLGDGLAEPIGKIYGKHKYKVRALFTDREYTRSLEGSACVAFFTAVGILVNFAVLSSTQLIILLAVLPALMAVVEAKSPHTWDNLFMYLSCWLVIYLVVFL